MRVSAGYLLVVASTLCLRAVADESSSAAVGPSGPTQPSAIRFASVGDPVEVPVARAPQTAPAVQPQPAPGAAVTNQAALPASPPAAGQQQVESAWLRLAAHDEPVPPPAETRAAPSNVPVTSPTTNVASVPQITAPAISSPSPPLPRPRSWQGGLENPAASPTDQRRLLGPRIVVKPTAEGAAENNLFESFDLPEEMIATTGAALGVVLGVMLLALWCLKRAAPRGARRLPNDLISVLGQVRLANKQTAQLLKIGSKLVLVNVTPDGVKPITEITDPIEVQRLLGIVEEQNPNGASAAFQEIFDQLTREPARGGLLGDEPSLLDRRRLAEAYANTPGGRARG